MVFAQAMSTDEIPSIPSFTVSAHINDYEPSLLWVHVGNAQIEIAGETHHLSEAEALWIPAGLFHNISVAEGSVVFPIPVPVIDLPASLNNVITLTIPPGWEDWLILQFAHTRGYLRGAVVPNAGLLDLITGSRQFPPGETGTENVPGIMPPPLPRSPAAVAVARVLLRTPGDATTLSTFALDLQVGRRTLQQQFVQQTGMSFSRWRTATRIAAGAAYLDVGRDISWVGHQVGFSTPAGFTRAFRTHTGYSPSNYVRTREMTPSAPVSTGSTLAQEVATLSTRDTGADGHRPAPPIPSSSTWARVNDFHVVIWVYRGTARLNIGSRTWRLHRGDAIWLPASVHNSIEIAENSLLLPLGDRTGTTTTGMLPLRAVHFPLAAENWLLHTVIANYTSLRPETRATVDPLWRTMQALSDAIRPPSGNNSEKSDLVQKIVIAVSRDLTDSRTLSDWARHLDVDPGKLHKLFVRATGQTFPRWRNSVRISLARQLLEGPMTPSEVARRVGYAHASSFTQAFSKTYGIPPSAYQQRGIQIGSNSAIDGRQMCIS